MPEFAHSPLNIIIIFLSLKQSRNGVKDVFFEKKDLIF